MAAWFRFFLGTPRRFLLTFLGLATIYGLFRPELVASAVGNLLAALINVLTPFVQPVLALGVAFIGLGIILRLVWRKGGKK